MLFGCRTDSNEGHELTSSRLELEEDLETLEMLLPPTEALHVAAVVEAKSTAVVVLDLALKLPPALLKHGLPLPLAVAAALPMLCGDVATFSAVLLCLSLGKCGRILTSTLGPGGGAGEGGRGGGGGGRGLGVGGVLVMSSLLSLGEPVLSV